MKNVAIVISLSASCLAACPVSALESGTVQLQSKNRIERTLISYDCGPAGRLDVTYVNADPNFLAILPVPKQPQPIIFVSVISGSGARYAAGKYVWWTKGNAGSLYDSTMGDNAAPVLTCTGVK